MITLFDTEVKKHAYGEVEVVKTLKSEKERLEALKDFFGIEYGDDAIEYIKGVSSAISNSLPHV